MIAKFSFHRQSSPPDPRSPRYQLRPLHFVAFVVVVLFASSRFLNRMKTQHEQLQSTAMAKEWLRLDENDWMHRILLLKDKWQKARSTARKDCGSLPFTKTDYYEFNISSNTGNEFRLLDRTVAEAREILQGTIDVIPGDFFQKSDIDMRIVTLSNDKDDLNNLHINISSSALDMEYSFENKVDICTKVNVFIFLRPNINIDIFDVWTTFLGVSFYNDLNVEIGNLAVHSSHGDPDMNNRLSLEPLVVHNISVSSIDGDIYSEFQPFGNIEVRNERGGTFNFIVPPYDLPFDPKSITMSSISGNIWSELVWQIWPEENFTHQYTIETLSGNIKALVPHGSYTNLSSLNGNITTTFWPSLAANPPQNEIYTSTPLGNTRLRLREGPSPAKNTLSRHEVGEGELLLRYPDSWYGNIEATVEHGEIQFEATLLEDFERGDGYVKAKRGRGESRMEAHMGTGIIDIIVREGS